MPLSAETLSALQQLMAQNTELLTQVQLADDTAQAATLIAKAAAKNGIDVHETELAEHLENASRTVTNQALSDQQLEAVAGGLNDDGRMALISVFTLGMGCALISLGQSLSGTRADGTAKYLDKKFC